MAHCNGDGHCRPGIRTLAIECRLSKGTVIKAIDELEKAGVFKVDRAPKANSLYHLMPLNNWNLSQTREQIRKKSGSKRGTDKSKTVPNEGTEVTHSDSLTPSAVVAVRWNDGKLLEEDFWNWCASLNILNRRMGKAHLIPDDVRRSAKWLLNRAWNDNAWFIDCSKAIAEWYSWPWTGKNEERKLSIRALMKDWQQQSDLAHFHIQKRKEFLEAGGGIQPA